MQLIREINNELAILITDSNTRTWNTLFLHWNTQPRACKWSIRGCGSNCLKAAWSFTFVIPPHANKAAASPFRLKPFKCKIVMFCRQLMLARDKSPTSVTEVYDKLICKKSVNHNKWYQLPFYDMWKSLKNKEESSGSLPVWGFERSEQVGAFQHH